MKVVHVASGDAWAGAERVIVSLAEGVGAQPGFVIEAVLLNEGRLAQTLRELGIHVEVIPESERSFSSLVRDLRRFLSARGADVVHAHRYKEILAAALASPRGRPPLVVTVHGLEPSSQLARSEMLLIWTTLIVARLSGARFVAVSEELTTRLARVLGGNRVTSIRNPMPTLTASGGLPDLRQRFGWNSSRPIVGFVGRLEPVKGPDLFLEIAKRARTDACFVLIGGGSLEKQLAGHVAGAGLGDRVGFLGETASASGYMRQFDVLALTSRHEGLPIVLLEAAANELPVVAFDVGGVRQVLDGGGDAVRVVPASRIDEFSAAVDDLLSNGASARHQAQRWSEAVRARFSLDAIAAQYADLYHSVARRE